MENLRLSCRNLAYMIGDCPVIDSINLELKSGDLMILQGQNGSGKTSLIKIIAGIIKPTDGEVFWNDQSIALCEDYAMQVNYCGHRTAIVPDMPVAAMVDFWAKLYHAPELLRAAVDYFDLAPYLDMNCGELSAGWQRKLDFTRLILNPAPLWLLDEPANHLDESSIHLLHALIQTRKEQGGIVVMVAHGRYESQSEDGSVKTYQLH